MSFTGETAAAEIEKNNESEGPILTVDEREVGGGFSGDKVRFVEVEVVVEVKLVAVVLRVRRKRMPSLWRLIL
jgi:hypothetical protein